MNDNDGDDEKEEDAELIIISQKKKIWKIFLNFLIDNFQTNQ